MTQDSLPSHVAGSLDEGPVEGLHVAGSFDVEPPYVPDPEQVPGLDAFPDRFLDREESWLRFNQRVLELAEDPKLPLLERARFLSIFASNLDEFFMVRVAGRMRRMATGLPVESMTGRPPEEVLSRTLGLARD